MCGIVGIVGREPAAPRIFEALRRLEYRGYDSAGIAVVHQGRISRVRAPGKLTNLADRLERTPLEGDCGIGHTRWATHGAPTELNAHPHVTSDLAVVHNGIIENFKALRAEIEAAGVTPETETDTEVIAHLLSLEMHAGKTAREAMAATLGRLEGAFALAILIQSDEGLMYGARRGSPLVVGYGDGEMFLGSDAIALAGLSNHVSYLEEGDWVELTHETATVFDANNRPVDREIVLSQATPGLIDKGNHRHFMQKEIFEQPTVVGQTLGAYVDPLRGRAELPDLPFDLADITKVTIIACGTSYYAGMVARYWLEGLARIPVEVDIASEFRYRHPVLPEGGLALFISQSGETADTIAALRHAREEGQRVVSIVNVMGSTMARESDVILPTHAGPEIGVASTKAFTCQLAVLAAFAVALARARGALDEGAEAALCQALEEVPSRMAEVLYHDEALQALAQEVSHARDVLYLGRGPEFPIALEGALKLKEISYIHAEGYAAGEMKHGPIALIDDGVPVIVVAPTGPLFEKTAANMQEVIARDGKVILMSDKAGIAAYGDGAIATIEMPKVNEIVAPLLYAIPVQLLAYHVAVHKGTDVDQPRNLAKSVTVE